MTRTPATTSHAARTGILLCVLSALCYGALPVLGKAAYAAGAGELALLTVRFGIAATLLWALVAWRRAATRLQWRAVARALAPGAPALAGGGDPLLAAPRRVAAGRAPPRV